MIHIEKKIDDRKTLVKRLEEVLDTKAKYMGMPSAAYQIGNYTVTKAGAIEVLEEDADEAVFSILSEEGFIEYEANKEREQEEPVQISISLPIDGHTGATLRNLINILYQRGSLINKSTGANFKIGTTLVEALQAEDDITTEKFLEIIGENENELSGLEFDGEQIHFTGYPELGEPETLDAELKLTASMNRQALEQKRIQPKVIDEENEKYAFRIWLTRIGMKGNEYKIARKILLQNLSGNSAFRTEEEAREFSEKQKAKRLAAKEAQV